MAKEYKTIKVHPNDEARMIRETQCFGWSLVGNQEVHFKDSHLESWGRDTYSVTRTTHYVKLTFERDPATLQNYDQLRRLENTYLSVPGPGKEPFVAKMKPAVTAGVIIYTVMILLMTLITGGWGTGIFVIAVIWGLAYLFKRFAGNKYSEWKARGNKFWEERGRIAQQAETYL